MSSPVGKPSLEIRSMKLSKDDPGDALLEPKPVVDEFGQWIPEDWPGKARNLDALQTSVGRRGKGARRGRRHAVLPLWRLPRRAKPKRTGYLPRREDGRQVVVRRSRRPSVPVGRRGLDRRCRPRRRPPGGSRCSPRCRLSQGGAGRRSTPGISSAATGPIGRPSGSISPSGG